MKLYDAQHPDGIDLGPGKAESRYDESAVARGAANKIGRMEPPRPDINHHETRGRPRKEAGDSNG